MPQTQTHFADIRRCLQAALTAESEADLAQVAVRIALAGARLIYQDERDDYESLCAEFREAYDHIVRS